MAIQQDVAVLVPPPQGPGVGDWLGSVLDAFYRLGPALLDLQHRAAVVAADAAQRGDAFAHQTARAAVEGIGDLRIAWGTTRDRFDALRRHVPGLGAIVVPVAYSAVAIAVAGAIWGIFRRASAEERIVELLEIGQLTPAEAEALLREAEGDGLGFALGGAGAVGLLVAAGALWLLTRR